MNSWTVFLGLGLLTAYSPGPAVALAIARTLSAGARAATVSSAGNVVGVLAVGTVCLLVLDGIAPGPKLLLGIKLAGGAYLLFLGIKATVRTKVGAPGIDPGALPVSSPILSFAEGAGVAMLNPKSYLFFAAVLPAFSQSRPARASLSLVVAFAACTALSHATYIAVCHRGPVSGRVGRLVARTCGAVTAFVGCSLLWDGVSS